MTRWTIPAGLLALAGCTSLTEPAVQRYEGFYHAGFEVDAFEPCGEKEQWWVREGAELRQRYAQTAGAEYERVFVVLRGEPSEPGEYGHLGAYARELDVLEVLEVRAEREGDCG